MRAAIVEAFIGTYEDELREKHALVFAGEAVAQDFAQWAEHAVIFGWSGAPFTCIMGSSNKEILAVYLQWNGILGYTETIWAIAQGAK